MDASVSIYIITFGLCGALMAYVQVNPLQTPWGKKLFWSCYAVLFVLGLWVTIRDSDDRELDKARAQMWLGQGIVQSAQQDQRAQQQQDALISLLKIVTTPALQQSLDAKTIARELAKIHADEAPALKHKVQALANEILMFVYQRQQRAPYHPGRVITEADKRQLEIAVPYFQETADLARDKFSTRLVELRNELGKNTIEMPRGGPPSEEYAAENLMKLGLRLLELGERL